jgi:osmotically-inducible protein OsmY
MKTYVWLAPLVLSASVVLPGCKDSDLEKTIKARLESDNDIKQAKLSVNANTSENKATIKGQVSSQDLRAKAIELAKSAQPGVTINDEIEVRPAG